MTMKTPKPYQPMQAAEGAIFQPFADQYGAPIGKLNIHVDGYEDNLKTVLNAPVYKDLAERLFAMLLVCADNDDPLWLSLKREAIEVLG